MNTTGWRSDGTARDRLHRRTTLFLVATIVAAAVCGVVLVGPVSAADITVISVTTTPERPTVYDDVTVEATISNLGDADRQYVIDRIVIRESADSSSDTLERKDTSVAVRPGTSESVSAEIEISKSGTRTVYAHLRILSGTGEPMSVVRPVTIEVLDPHPSLSLRASPIDAANRTRLSINVVNGRQGAIQGLSLAASADDLRIQEPRRVAGSLAAGETRTFEFVGIEAAPGPETVNVTMDYVTSDGTHRSTTTTLETELRPRQNPARIALTNTRITREDGSLVVRGDVSNVGGTNASGVQVAVESSGAVQPAQDRATFFARAVKPNEYSTFTVHAAVENASGPVSIPIRVTYTVDGVDRTQTFELGYTPALTANTRSTDGGGSPLAIVGVVAALVLGVAALYGVYRYRTGDDGDA